MKSFNARPLGRTAAICGLAALVCFGLGRAVPAAPEPAAASGTAQAVVLQYREQPDLPLASAGLAFSAQTASFKKEPEVGPRKVVRGVLKFGNRTEQFVPLLWDCTQRKLYLDLNRNQDLTDDGVLVSGDRNYGGNYYYQTFTNIHFSFKTPMGEHRVLADLHCHSYNNQPGVTASLRSFWEGKISLGGRDWQVGFVEAGSLMGKIGSPDNGYLLLRPWDQRQQSVTVDNERLEGVHFCRQLFFDHRSYQVDCAYIQQEGAPGYRLELKEHPAELGELKLNGQFIQRLVLRAERAKDASVVVLDHPGPVERMPVGSYEVQVHLQQGKVSAYPSSPRWPKPRSSVVVSAAQPATLTIGGPLTNTVAVSQRGRELYLSYSLVGARGETYELGGPRTNPGFVVSQAGKQLSSGQFEFG